MKYIKPFFDLFLKFVIVVSASPVFAVIPVPSKGNIPSDSVTWLDILKTNVEAMIKASYAIVASGMVLGVSIQLYKSYVLAHEKNDYTGFFKSIAVGVIMIVLGIAIIYYGNTIL